jgi:hypothetical protein
MRSRDDNTNIEPPPSSSHHTPTSVINIARFFVMPVYRSTMFLYYRETYRCSPAYVVAKLDFMAPHCYMVVDTTVTSARMNTSIPQIGARFPLPGGLALGAQQGKLDADLRTSALLGTPSILSVHDYYPFALEDGGLFAPMAAALVDCLAILVASRRRLGIGGVDSFSLESESYVRMRTFVRRRILFP